MILSTVCYIERDGKYLLLHRTKKKNDINSGKWLGVGGKLEAGETPDECVLRETREETGYTLSSFRMRGTVDFYSDDGYAERLYLYHADAITGSPAVCDEGELAWIEKNEACRLPMWEGDKVFFPLIDADGEPFHLELRYSGDRLISSKRLK